MEKLVLIFGNGAVGKMTVGQELAKITNLRLFHNHMSIEPIIEIFGEYNPKIIDEFRQLVFNNFLESDKYGLIFTFIWAFDSQDDWNYVINLKNKCEQKGVDVCFVELVAPQNIRLERNKTENRLANKASKRNIDFSSNIIINDDKNHRLESNDGEIPFENYIKIDNSNLEPNEVAKMIKGRFGLK
ncbi:MAG: shikimate kinase [Clostridia bacterium]|nr:shikimate kinase [Clostridia bacterium]